MRSEKEPSTVCSVVAPRRIHSSPKPDCEAGGDHGVQFLAGGFVADAMFEVAIGAHLSASRQGCRLRDARVVTP